MSKIYISSWIERKEKRRPKERDEASLVPREKGKKEEPLVSPQPDCAENSKEKEKEGATALFGHHRGGGKGKGLLSDTER